ncbi:thioredoxin family protein [Gloeocapsa sp. PCC 73106]|uniref:thioredoxin family protein n=1 Tax=Gloeocapsa sp. PCC 73106 TaxID=102232 RepID=UPI0002ACFB8C|nr:thioredoxin family protein [Gloeocapsa sp. PCC 73106]ELR97681.1 Peroxiredoxin [Gloeocapsa sp. PCC 73106]
MALTPSTMLPLGTKAPDFQLVDVLSNQTISLSDFSSHQALLVIFLCCHCPFVKHVEQEIAKLSREYQPQNIGIIAISVNDIERYPDDAPDKLKIMAETLGFNFPVCYDQTQNIAKAYKAACTPDFFLFDSQLKLVYRGQLDDSRPGNNLPITGKDLRSALDAIVAGKPVNLEQKPSIGCNIKWKPGNEPDY